MLGFDGSGSVRASDFEILKKYGLALIKNYQMQYFVEKAIGMGIMQFGNGVINCVPRNQRSEAHQQQG